MGDAAYASLQKVAPLRKRAQPHHEAAWVGGGTDIGSCKSRGGFRTDSLISAVASSSSSSRWFLVFSAVAASAFVFVFLRCWDGNTHYVKGS